MPLSTLTRCDAPLRPPPGRRSVSLKLCWPVCRNLIPLLITGLQRQWTQWGQRASFHVTSEASLGKRHGRPPPERRPGSRGAVLHDYITANQRRLWAAWLYVAGTPEPHSYRRRRWRDVLWQIRSSRLWWSMSGLYATSRPPPYHLPFLPHPLPCVPEVETEGGLRHGGTW